ncbi:MAG: polysaccharide deacetylase family protein [Gammaproteobacteria bacterium]|nr:MAG: polysaccharide deacetylase family protein [Gammaproteobacteria bacterium]
MPERSAHQPRRPSALIRGSVALHLAAVGVMLARPPLWPWALSAMVADHLLLTAAGLWPRSRLLGPNWTRLPAAAAGAAAAIAITIDDGPDPEITPRVLALLEAHGAQATFFCIGERVDRHPRLAREIVQRGHAIENHSQRHLQRFSLLGPRALAQEIGRAQQTIAAATGEVAQFFRAPAGLRNPFLEPVLARANLRLVSWTRRGFDTVSGSAARVLGRLTRHLQDGDILLLHDGHAARTAAGGAVILEVLPALLAAAAAARLTPVTLRAAAVRAGRH